jgi:hypothetical protein
MERKANWGNSDRLDIPSRTNFLRRSKTHPGFRSSKTRAGRYSDFVYREVTLETDQSTARRTSAEFFEPKPMQFATAVRTFVCRETSGT